MQRRRFALTLGAAAGAVALPALAQTTTDDPDGATILARATEAAGGDGWARVKTLFLEGRAEFWGPTGAAPRSRAATYTMWRVFDPERSASHGAEGKVRIVARNGDRLMFTVGYDGRSTWTERGVTPQAEADAFWASNFGFGIIRHAHPVFLVRLTDPQGGVSLFGIDRRMYGIRSIGFATPRGWHERHYDHFVRQENPAWLQAREVTLYYNGAKANVLHWEGWVIDGPIGDRLFAPPASFPPPANPLA